MTKNKDKSTDELLEALGEVLSPDQLIIILKSKLRVLEEHNFEGLCVLEDAVPLLDDIEEDLSGAVKTCENAIIGFAKTTEIIDDIIRQLGETIAIANKLQNKVHIVKNKTTNTEVN